MLHLPILALSQTALSIRTLTAAYTAYFVILTSISGQDKSETLFKWWYILEVSLLSYLYVKN